MRSIGMLIYTTVEDTGSILPNSRRNQRLTTRVIFDKRCYVVNDTADNNKRLVAAPLGFRNKLIPIDNWQLIQRDSPIELCALLINLLLQLLKEALFDFILTELLQVVR